MSAPEVSAPPYGKLCIRGGSKLGSKLDRNAALSGQS